MSTGQKLYAELRIRARELTLIGQSVDEIATDPEFRAMWFEHKMPAAAIENQIRDDIREMVQSWMDEDTGQHRMVSTDDQPALPDMEDEDETEEPKKKKQRRKYRTPAEVMADPTLWQSSLNYFFKRLRGSIQKFPLLSESSRTLLLNCVTEIYDLEIRRIG